MSWEAPLSMPSCTIIAADPSICRPRRDRALPAERELVLDSELQDDRVARPREAEARAGDELEPARDAAVHDREDVVLLVARAIDGAYLSDAAVELHARDEIAREPVVDARGVVELEGPPLLAHRRQLERRVQI